MKRKIFFLLLSLTLVISSCGILRDNIDSIMKVTEGMSPQEVTSLLGTPRNRSFDGAYETWEYSFYADMGQNIRICIVEFEAGKVKSMETFYPTPPPTPTIKVETTHTN